MSLCRKKECLIEKGWSDPPNVWSTIARDSLKSYLDAGQPSLAMFAPFLNGSVPMPSRKTVALFGLGDQEVYPKTFLDTMHPGMNSRTMWG